MSDDTQLLNDLLREFGRFNRRLTEIERKVDNTTAGQDSLHTSVEPGATFNVLDSAGNVAARLNGDRSGVLEHVDGPTPEQPATPELYSQPGIINVILDGADVHGNEAPADFKQVRVHFSKDEDFTPYEGTWQGTISEARGEKAFPVHPGIWYVAVEWETLSGKISSHTVPVEIEVDTLVDISDLEDHLDTVRAELDTFKEEFSPVLDELDVKLSDLKPGEPVEAVVEQLWASLAVVDRLVARDAWVENNMLVDGAVHARNITVTEELAARVGNFLKVTADMIETNALDGMTITGATLQTVQAAQSGVKIHNNQLRVWDSNGRETVRLGDGEENFLSGRLYTNAPGESGIILFPETSRGLPGIWFSEDGTSASTHPSIFVDSDWNLNVRAKSGSTGRGNVRFHGSIEAVDSAILTSGGHGVYSDGTIVGTVLEAYRRIYYWDHPTTGSSTNGYINASTGLVARVTSARKYKTDIQKTDVPDGILNLDLSTWVDKNEKAELDDLRTRMPLTEQDTLRFDELQQEQRKIGLIADEVAEIDSRFVTYLDGEIDGLAYDRLGVAWIPLVRKQRDKIAAQQQRIDDLEQRLQRLEQLVERTEGS